MDAIAERLLKPEAAPERTPVPPFDLVIFGAGGDLALRKLFPALAQRNEEGVLPQESRILGIVRKQEDVEGIPNEIAAKLAAAGLSQDRIAAFRRRLTMVLLDAVKPETYGALKEALGDSQRVRSFYLSTPPDLFIPICENLANSGILTPTSRVILEKPLGRDLASAREINDAVARILPESRTYRIDHYLGKETVQNLLVLRFANTLFERSWSSRDIDNVQITVAETVGLESRAGYYDKAGHLRDMVQNHVLQLLCLFAIEPPNQLEADAVRDEKVRVLKALRPIVGPDVQRMTVRGQYGPGVIDGQRVKGYSEEPAISAAPRPSSRSAAKPTPGAGPACRSICAPASAWRSAIPRSRSPSSRCRIRSSAALPAARSFTPIASSSGSSPMTASNCS